MANSNAANPNRLERILTYMIASAIGLSLISFFAIIIGTSAGVRNFTEGLWLTVAWIPMIGLPLGFVLIIAVLVITFRRRAQEAKDAGK